MTSNGQMDNSQLTAYLNEYIKMNRPQFAVMITGKWGCGKTYYIDGLIKEWEKAKVKTDKESILLKPVYVSVYGLHTISEVVRKIRMKVRPWLYSKGAAVAKKVVLTSLQILTKSKVDLDKDGSGEDMNDLLDAEGILEIFKSDSSSIKGNKILVFDDLERNCIPLDEFFGFVNGIVEHSDSKVILICEEDKLQEAANKDELKVAYKDFKEKLVGQTFSLNVDYAAIAGSFIQATGNRLVIDNHDLIVNLFVASKCENLRIIKRSLLDIERLFNQLPKGIEKIGDFALFAKNVIAYLVIASIEERLGDKEVEKFQSYSFSDEAKKVSQKFEEKYNPVLEHFHLYHSSNAIPIPSLLTFVRTGYLSDPEELVTGCWLLQSKNLANWEKLWWCSRLSNEEFVSLLAQEKKRFYNKELTYAFEVAHLAGILLSLEKRRLVKLSRKHVVSIAKRNITEIHSTYPNDMSRIAMSSQGYEFQESNSEEMQEILSYASSLLQKRTAGTEKKFVTDAWNKLSSGMSHNDIDNLFNQPTPMHRCHYSQEGIFWQVSPKVLVEKILSLSNATKLEFSFFLTRRYYLKDSHIIGTLYEEMKIDKSPLEKISTSLKSKAKRLKLIDKEATLRIASKMDEAVKKM